MRVAHGVGRGSRRGAKGGVCVDGPAQLFCIRARMEASVYEQPSLVLLLPSMSGGHESVRLPFPCPARLLAVRLTANTGPPGG